MGASFTSLFSNTATSASSDATTSLNEQSERFSHSISPTPGCFRRSHSTESSLDPLSITVTSQRRRDWLAALVTVGRHWARRERPL